MSNEVFPAFPGKEFPSGRTSVWRTIVKGTPSDREYRSTDIAFPRYRYKWSYEFLRKKQAYTEWPEAEGFFNRHKGRMDDFLLEDPDDNYITNQVFAIGDGVTTKFALVRVFGGFVMPIGRPFDISAADSAETEVRLDYWGGSDVRVRSGSYANHFGQSSGLNGASWTRSGVTVATNVADLAPDSSTATAEQFTVDAANTTHQMAIQHVTTMNSGSQLVVSFYVKYKAGSPWVNLRVGNAANSAYAYSTFNIQTGALGTLYNEVGSCDRKGRGIYPADNGWYRIYLAVDMQETDDNYGARLFAMDADSNTTTWTGDSTTSFLVWGAQAEASSIPEPSKLIPTPSTTLVSATIYTINDFGTVSFTVAPVVGETYFWNGYYYWRMRFDKDEMDFNKFMQGFWSWKGVEMITVKAAT